MGSDLVIRSVEESDKDEILELLRLSLGEGSIPRTREYWSWKHERNPFGGSAAIVAESKGTIVGLRVFMRWTLECAGHRVRAVRAVDTATHPGWRGQGIFSRLTLALVDQMRDEQVTVVFNTPNRFSRPGYLKMGWASLGRVSLWIRPRLTVPLGKEALRRIRRSPVIESVPLEEGRFSPASDLMKNFEHDRLEERQAHDGALRTATELAYLRWRYAESPGFKYSATWKRVDGGAAAVIFRVSRRGGLRELRLCQILLSSSRIASRLARELLIQVMRETRPDYAVSMSRTPQESRTLVGAGFLPAPSAGPILTVRSLNDAPRALNLLDRAAWRFCIGDLELF